MPLPLLPLLTLSHTILSLGHTLKGSSQFSHPSLSSLPPPLRGAVKIGWYEGSVWFLIAAVLNYKWSVSGLGDGADKLVAGLLVGLMGGAGWSVSLILFFFFGFFFGVGWVGLGWGRRGGVRGGGEGEGEEREECQ